MWCKVSWLLLEIVVLELNMVLGVKYHNDVRGNTVQVDKSTRFHVFELHEFSVGATSSVFIAAFLLLCATYVAMKLGLSKVLRCCCHCQERMEDGGEWPGTTAHANEATAAASVGADVESNTASE